MAAAAMVEMSGGGTWAVSVLMIAIASVTIVAVLLAHETAPLIAKVPPAST